MNTNLWDVPETPDEFSHGLTQERDPTPYEMLLKEHRERHEAKLKHACCEKPMCLSMEEANEMTCAIEAMKVDGAAAPPPVFFLAYPRRFGIDDHKILSTIRTTLGQPVFYRDVWGVVKGHVSEVIHEETGGGGLLFENSHTIDSYNMTFGRPVKVFAIAVRMPLIVPMVIILQFQRKKRA
jgi:predicted dehydrogenase